jgi:hypothetical protein
MANSYISHFEYLRSPTGIETASMLGNSMRLSGVLTAGGTTLNVTPPLTVQLNPYDQVTIFDGSSSEVVIVNTTATIGATSISIQTPGLQFGHAQNTPLCSDGVLGSLANEILTASDMVEDACLQSLILGTRTDTLALGTLRAAISNDRVLHLRPENFPVISVIALSLVTPGMTIALDPTQAFLDSGQQLVKFFQLVPLSSTPAGNPYQTQLNQRTVGTIALSYTSGFAYSAMPPRIKKACVLFTSDLLNKRRNSLGASDYHSGKVHYKMGHIGDTSGQSDLVKQGLDLLSGFMQEKW